METHGLQLLQVELIIEEPTFLSPISLFLYVIVFKFYISLI